MAVTDDQEVTLVLANQVSEIGRLAEAVEAFGESHGLGPKVVYALQLALEEIVMNVISYGWSDGGAHEVRVRVGRDDGGVTASVEDDGRAFDPLGVVEQDLSLPLEQRRPGGLGVMLTRKFMDEVQYARAGERNVLTMRKRVG